ncbi:hypothetical protein ACWN88_11605 [Vagococcus silagei]
MSKLKLTPPPMALCNGSLFAETCPSKKVNLSGDPSKLTLFALALK